MDSNNNNTNTNNNNNQQTQQINNDNSNNNNNNNTVQSENTNQNQNIKKNTNTQTMENIVRLPNVPVITALKIFDTKNNFNMSWLIQLVEGRELFIGKNAFDSIEELETYGEKTHATLLYLMIEQLGEAFFNDKLPYPINQSQINDNFKAASHIGAFLTIAHLIRSIPLACSNGFLPVISMFYFTHFGLCNHCLCVCVCVTCILNVSFYFFFVFEFQVLLLSDMC